MTRREKTGRIFYELGSGWNMPAAKKTGEEQYHILLVAKGPKIHHWGKQGTVKRTLLIGFRCKPWHLRQSLASASVGTGWPMELDEEGAIVITGLFAVSKLEH